MENNPLIIFTADNGNEIYYPKKRRVEKSYSNIKTGELFDNLDLGATLADVTGFSKPFNSDGVSFFDELTGENDNSGHRSVVYSSYTGPTLITKDGWKIRTDLNKDVFELFYLPDDFREENDLSEQSPQKLRELKRQLLIACDGDYENGFFKDNKNVLKVSMKL